MYAVILNFETASVDVVDLNEMGHHEDPAEFIESELDYSLSNAEWMIVNEYPRLYRVN
jgi:hypothetical protein